MIMGTVLKVHISLACWSRNFRASLEGLRLGMSDVMVGTIRIVRG